MDEAKGFGLMNGVAIALVEEGSRSIGGFARADRDYVSDEIVELEDQMTRLHRSTLNLRELTGEDREALMELSVKLTH